MVAFDVRVQFTYLLETLNREAMCEEISRLSPELRRQRVFGPKVDSAQYSDSDTPAQ